MAPLNEEQLESIRLERKQQMMRAAIKVFAENGIKLTKISMIAKEAGVSHGLLYHYFDSKEEVLHQSLEWAMEATVVQEDMGQLMKVEMPAVEKIRLFTRFAFEESNGDIFRVIQHVDKSEDVLEKTQTMVESAGGLYIGMLTPLFDQGQREGDIIDGEPSELANLFLTVIAGIITDSLEWWKKGLDSKLDILMRMITVR
ncbi:TetR/AcrR family transcriptional regulator [Paenibacillus daejeonensis]|uniref:TetR/AcrR family transcriptional regulator n=1 Tax=Paenibacillus daejeonensis TaxID=135193 RepID=UPI00036F7950|nr:TetR/AcrR family transcriptional regulator [Paenibacillus daejeonensis]